MFTSAPWKPASLLLCALSFAPSGLQAQAVKGGGSTAGRIVPPSSAPQDHLELSPRAAYDDAMHPVILTRNSILNWSETELSALNVAVMRGRDACEARDAKKFAGTLLVDLARLCALGQDWSQVVVATTRFIDDPANATSAVLPDAYAARVDADLHLKSGADALRDALVMLARTPYTPIVAEASSEAIGYLRFSATPDAITVAKARQGLVLAAIQAQATTVAVPATTGTQTGTPTGAPAGTTAALPAATPQPPKISLHDLYAQGLSLPSLEQLNADAAAADADFAALEAALPAKLDPDEALPMATLRRRYRLLGRPLASIDAIHYLSAPNRVPDLPAPHTTTAFLLFPDWCAQCVAMGQRLPETVFSVGGYSAYLYGLLALTTPQRAIPPSPDADGTQHFSPSYAAAMLSEHPVVTVPPATLERFAATEFPFLIVADAQGIVRALELMDADDLQPGGLVDQAVLDVAARWAAPKPKPAAAAPSAEAQP